MTLPRLAHPEALWLLLLGVPIVWLGLRSLVVLEPIRKWTAVGLRLAVLLVLVLMLAGLQAVQRHEDLTVMALVDRSESVRRFATMPTPAPGSFQGHESSEASTDYEAWAPRWLREAGFDRRTDDRFGLMGFADRPRLEVMPTKGVRTDTARIDAAGDGTDLAAAIRSAMGLLPPDSGARLVLISDGNQSAHAGSRRTLDEDVLAAAREAKAAGIPVDVAPVNYAARREVLVEAVYAPTQARQGRTVGVRVALRATAPAAGTLELMHDDELIDVNGPDTPGTGLSVEPAQWTRERDEGRGARGEGDADRAAAEPPEGGGAGGRASGIGEYVLVKQVDVPVSMTGVNRFEAVFEPLSLATGSSSGGGGASGGGGGVDRLAANNRAEGFTLVSGKGKVLVVDGEGGASGSVLPSALASRGIELDVVPPQGMPSRLSRLQRYDAVVFQNVPRDLVTLPQQRDLVRYVHDLGGGFVMVGGDDSFGAGGWTNSPIDERILPVECQIPTQTVLPTGALMLVIDRSGSMHAPVGGSNKTQIDLAAEAAVMALQTLYPQDYVGVVSFDSQAYLVADLGPNNNPRGVASKIRSIQAGGGTSITPGLEMARRELESLQTTDAAIKHVVLITDGQSAPPPGNNWARVIGPMMQRGITVSSIGVGDSRNSQMLSLIANMGNGSYHDITNPNSLPQVFIKEAKTIRKSLIKETEFTPRLVSTGSPVTKNLPGTPPLRGLVLTGPKRDPRVFTPMLGPEGEPLFAHWQTGLGRAAAFTSDATNRWATPWLQWGGYPDFWARTLRHVSRPSPTRSADLLADVRGDTLKLRLDAASPESVDGGGRSSSFDNFVQARGAVIKPDGSVVDVSLQQTGPGLYEADVPADVAGSYVVSLMLMEPNGGRRTVFGGANRPINRELRQFRSNPALLERVAEITGGRVLDVAQPRAAGLFSRDGYTFETRSVRPLWRTLLIALLALVLLDVANRRIAWDPVGLWRWGLRRIDGVLGVLTLRDKGETKADTMGSLKAARQRATARFSTPQPSPTGTAGKPAGNRNGQPAAAKQPEARPHRNRKFEAAPDAQVSDDVAAALGGATESDPVGVRLARAGKANRNDDEEEASTTSRLMAAKRAARDRLKDEKA